MEYKINLNLKTKFVCIATDFSDESLPCDIIVYLLQLYVVDLWYLV